MFASKDQFFVRTRGYSITASTANTISTMDLTLFGSKTLVDTFFVKTVTKRLYIAIDPLTDRTVLVPSDSYNSYST